MDFDTFTILSAIFYSACCGQIILVGEACEVTISNSSGTFSSGYPTLYEPNLNCTWDFQAPEGKVIEITFDHVEFEPEDSLETCADSITVYDPTEGSDFRTAIFCEDGPGWPRHPTRYLSTTNRLIVQMKTDNVNSFKGFSARYKQVTPRTEYIAAIGTDVVSIVRFDRFSQKGMPRFTLPRSTSPSALTFDPINEYFYYTDVQEKFIGRVKITGETHDILVNEYVDTPLGVAVAYITGLMYWVDTGRKEVSMSRLDGSSRKYISPSDSGCETPRAITLSLDHRFVFWTCKHNIKRSTADGSNQILFVDGLNDVRTVAVDPYDDALYWINVLGTTGDLEKIKLNGTGREVVYRHELFASFHGFAMDEFALFWSHPSDRKLYHVERGQATLRSLSLVSNPPAMEGLYYYKSDQDIPAQHQCAIDNGGCSDLCIPDESNNVVCIEVKPLISNCPEDIHMVTDGPEVVSWSEPTAVSRIVGNSPVQLPFASRSKVPGSTFHWGTTTVIYLFSDGLGNEANCSFNIELSRLPTTSPGISSTPLGSISTTARIFPATTRDADPPSIVGEYLPYVIVVVAVAVVSLIGLVVVILACIGGYCRCSCRPQSRRAIPDQQMMHAGVSAGNNVPLYEYAITNTYHDPNSSSHYSTIEPAVVYPTK